VDQLVRPIPNFIVWLNNQVAPAIAKYELANPDENLIEYLAALVDVAKQRLKEAKQNE
jgi:hypothetical protein